MARVFIRVTPYAIVRAVVVWFQLGSLLAAGRVAAEGPGVVLTKPLLSPELTVEMLPGVDQSTKACGVALCDTNLSTASTCVVSEPKELKCEGVAGQTVCPCAFLLDTNLEVLAPITCGTTDYSPYQGVSDCKDLTLCSIILDVGLHSITIRENGTLNAPSVEIKANELVLRNNSNINASYLGYPPLPAQCVPRGQPTTSEYVGYGASHGGTGGLGGKGLSTACSTYNSYLDQPQTKGKIIGNATFPDEKSNWGSSFGASGGCDGETCGGRGGGRIRITVLTADLGDNGAIIADGHDAFDGNPSKVCCGGGAGGTVALDAAFFKGDGPMSASGGAASLINSTNVRGAGGGGRVVLKGIGKSSYGGKISAFGGTTPPSNSNAGSVSSRPGPIEPLRKGPTPISAPNCYSGGHGTIYNIAYKVDLQKNTSVVEISGPSNTDVTPQSVTPLQILPVENVNSLYIESSAVVQAENLTLALLKKDDETSGMFVNTNALALVNFGNSTSAAFQAQRISIGKYGVIDATGLGTSTGVFSLNVGSGGLTVVGNLAFQGDCDIQTKGLVTVSGCLGTNCNYGGLERQRRPVVHRNASDAWEAPLGFLRPEENGKNGIPPNPPARRRLLQTVSGRDDGENPEAEEFTVEWANATAEEPFQDPSSDSSLQVGSAVKRGGVAYPHVGAQSSGTIFINSSMGISIESSGVLFADAFVLITDKSGINFASASNPSAGGTQRGPCLQQVTAREQCDQIVDSVFNQHKRPTTNFTAIALARGGNIAVPGFLGGDRLLFCTLGHGSKVTVGGTISSKGNGCPGAYKVGSSPYPDGGGFCNESTTAGGGGGHGGNGGESLPDKQQGGIAYPPRPKGSLDLVDVPILDHSAYGLAGPEPLLAGAGGGCAGGGAGGGVVIIDTEVFVLYNTGKVIADGLPGEASTGVNQGGFGGGGAGGSVTITATNFLTSESGLITVNGGSGVNTNSKPGPVSNGGGGAGGRLLINWKPSLFQLMSGTPIWTQNFSGNITLLGGAPNGGSGLVQAPECPTGFMLTLGDGSMSNGVPKCVPCPEGMYSNDETINVTDGNKVCRTCLPGKYANGTGNSACTACSPGSTCTKRGCGFCPLCAAGKYASSNVSCSQCNNKPYNSRYNVPGQSSKNCAYTCSAGYVGTTCITPLARLIQALGGPFTALGILSGSLFIVISASYLMCVYVPGCPGHRRERFDIKQFKGLRRLPTMSMGSDSENNSQVGSGYNTPSYMSPMLKPAGHPTFDSPMMNQGFDRGTFERNYAVRGMSQEQQHELALMLMERDLGYHVYRLYARGNNTPGHAWQFPLKLPSDLQAIIDEKRYGAFINTLNKEMAWHENGFFQVVRCVGKVLFYPFCRKLYNARRQQTIVKARQCVFEYDHVMMRGHKARALMNTIKIGSDDGNTTCYMDILYVEVMPIPPPLRLGKPELPLALVFSGDGSWDSPFRLDPMDVLVASVPNFPMLSTFIDTKWSSFLTVLNSALRTVLPGDIDGTIHHTLRVLDEIEADDLGGLRLRLATFYPSGVMRLGLMIDTFSSKQASNSFGSLGSYTKSAAPKEAGRQISLPKRDSHGSVAGAGQDSQGSSKRRSQGRARSIREIMLADENEEDESILLMPDADIGYSGNIDFRASTSAKKRPLRGKTSSTGSEKDGAGADAAGGGRVRAGSKGRDDRAPTIDAAMYQETIDFDDDDVEVWVYDGLPYVPRSPQRGNSEWCYRYLMSMVKIPLWRAMPARTVEGREWFRWTLIILLLCDTIATAFLILNLWCIQINPSSDPDSGCSRLGLVGFLSMYPFASVTSPFLGITATAFSLPAWARRFAEWNGLSMLNACVGLGVYYHYRHYLDISSLACPAALLLLKVFEGLCNAKNLAYLENGKSNERSLGGDAKGGLDMDFSSPPGANRGRGASPLTI
jgi:hypothetical protein